MDDAASDLVLGRHGRDGVFDAEAAVRVAKVVGPVVAVVEGARRAERVSVGVVVVVAVVVGAEKAVPTWSSSFCGLLVLVGLHRLVLWLRLSLSLAPGSSSQVHSKTLRGCYR